jgi:hypothetical protein
VPLPLRVFINYRHDDTWGQAMLLYDRLAGRFGGDNVFLDARNLEPGMEWLEEIRSNRDSCNVLLSLIGPHWMSSLKAREQASFTQPTEDYVRFEIEYALRRNSGIYVIPVLVGDAVIFSADALPRSLKALASIEAEQVRQKRFDEDVTHLASRLEKIARERVPSVLAVTEPVPVPPVPPEPVSNSIAPVPTSAHYDLILQHMVDEGNLVPFLGSHLAGRRAGTPPDSQMLPDAQELAADLAGRFGLKAARLDLPEVAQYVYVTKGRPDLYRSLRQLLKEESEPGPVHRFLARLPGKTELAGLGKRYQLIVSTNFDNALEKAFDDEREPYDLAVYMASGPDRGKFVHFPYQSGPEAVVSPNSYVKFPIGDYGDLERTIILKIHGAMDGNVGSYRFRENYVITEDHYIEYLSRSPVENLVPTQILDKLQDSHCMFLGYSMRDWYLRVFIKRIWRGEPLGARSWAVEPRPDLLEKDFWAQANVDLYASDLTTYVSRLTERLAEWVGSRTAP